jgi:hypothetical protein
MTIATDAMVAPHFEGAVLGNRRSRAIVAPGIARRVDSARLAASRGGGDDEGGVVVEGPAEL